MPPSPLNHHPFKAVLNPPTDRPFLHAQQMKFTSYTTLASPSEKYNTTNISAEVESSGTTHAPDALLIKVWTDQGFVKTKEEEGSHKTPSSAVHVVHAPPLHNGSDGYVLTFERLQLLPPGDLVASPHSPGSPSTPPPPSVLPHSPVTALSRRPTVPHCCPSTPQPLSSTSRPDGQTAVDCQPLDDGEEVTSYHRTSFDDDADVENNDDPFKG
ncbi:LOW QUALITY PROTEIN: hypothetical protein Cgig2_016358 [Carnegiea gigantea]|uniref:Uncharacterized protein n=1 Tax=Carnegiea gigantea TaxID=171969 RepID=A0A9Q1Q8G9_9CARY|nr:LOW QUALITY PROTEIN: hypothetical protein Cgig2_016358 [Carnegiea gigantea]